MNIHVHRLLDEESTSRLTYEGSIDTLAHPECSCCNERNELTHFVAATECRYEVVLEIRRYFTRYHLVCLSCSNHIHQGHGLAYINRIPLWSRILDFIEARPGCPGGMVSLSDTAAVENLMREMFDNTDSWDDFRTLWTMDDDETDYDETDYDST